MLGLRSILRTAVTLATSIALGAVLLGPASVQAQERLPWDNPAPSPGGSNTYARTDAYQPDSGYGGSNDYPQRGAYRADDTHRSGGNGDAYVPPPAGSGHAYGNDDQRYAPYPEPGPEPYERDYGPAPEPRRGYGEPPPQDYGAYDRYDDRTYSRNEILDTGHAFFGSVSRGLANVVEYAFQKAGRPNGYILGEDAGGAFIAGLRYGEGTLYTKDAGVHKVYWQGPSVGYDFGGEGSKTMILVYNLRHPYEIFNRFGGVQGSAYFVGGAGIQFQKHGDVVLAPIRSGIGFRLGANVGYLKYTRTPTWNPF